MNCRVVAILVLGVSSGCASNAPSPEEYAGAKCVRDALASEPQIANSEIVVSAGELLVRFDFKTASGHTIATGFEVARDNEYRGPGLSPITYTYAGPTVDLGLGNLLEQKCPDLRDDTSVE
jgi:hypothetical protein